MAFDDIRELAFIIDVNVWPMTQCPGLRVSPGHGVSAYEDHHYLTLTSARQHTDTTVDRETHAGESDW